MPELPFSRRRALAGAALLVLALALGGRLLLHAGTASPAGPPPLAPTAVTAPSAPAELVVDVVGAVRRPGLYRLAQGARIADAVRRAGGSTRRADLTLVNLAAPLADGEQIVVPARGSATAAAGGSAASAPVDLNSATPEQLDALPGVGPATAAKIIAYRQAHGPFRSVDELDAVPGIGPARIEQLKGLVLP